MMSLAGETESDRPGDHPVFSRSAGRRKDEFGEPSATRSGESCANEPPVRDEAGFAATGAPMSARSRPDHSGVAPPGYRNPADADEMIKIGATPR